MPAAPTSYVLLDIGYETILLPASTNLDKLLKALSPAIRVRRHYEGVGCTIQLDGQVDIRATIISAASISFDVPLHARAPSTAAPRTHAAALPARNPRRLTA